MVAIVDIWSNKMRKITNDNNYW